MIIYDRKLNFEHLGESRLDLGYEPLETLLVSICLYVYICIYIYTYIVSLDYALLYLDHPMTSWTIPGGLVQHLDRPDALGSCC